ncbi:MAG TPA: hypothetical protein VGN77_06270 [Steroidobacteraceae bacterium]|nr:hypothetical protein [Steroidobacteraceae bacterium]
MNRELVAPAFRRLSARHLALPVIAISLALQASTVSIAKTRHSTPAPAPTPDPGYASALAAANRFLQAWQNQDHETGLLMLTDVAKQNSSQDRLEDFFASGHDAAYEIARGKKLKAGCYAFPVALFTSAAGMTSAARPQKSQIVVVRAGKDEWAIDKLP